MGPLKREVYERECMRQRFLNLRKPSIDAQDTRVKKRKPKDLEKSG
jgi:hypothetical protein